MNGVIFWDGKLIPLAKFAEMLEIEMKKIKKEDQIGPPELSLFRYRFLVI